MPKTISIIVPSYNEQNALPLFYEEICRVLAEMSEKYGLFIELLFIDDGSTDHTLDILRELSQNDQRVRYLSFSRNFGKEAGIFAGLKNATGDYIAIMDVDLQDPPSLLIDMYLCIKEEDYDCVATQRVTRKGEPLIRSFFAKAFYKLINRISHTEIVDGARDYRMMTRQMVNSILKMSEYNRFSKGIFGWVGYKTKWLQYDNIERVAGETKWSFWKLVSYSIDGIVSFSTMPLSLAFIMGLIFCSLACILILIIVIRTLTLGDPVAGYPSMLCIILLIGGIQLFCIGIIGKYLAKTYLETKKRPIYIVREDDKSGKR